MIGDTGGKKGDGKGARKDAITDWKTGQMGRVAVIGGSEDYTGAPYFSAMASARLGADMVCLIFQIGRASCRERVF